MGRCSRLVKEGRRSPLCGCQSGHARTTKPHASGSDLPSHSICRTGGIYLVSSGLAIPPAGRQLHGSQASQPTRQRRWLHESGGRLLPLCIPPPLPPTLLPLTSAAPVRLCVAFKLQQHAEGEERDEQALQQQRRRLAARRPAGEGTRRAKQC